MAAPGGWSALFSTAFKQSRNAMVLVDDGRRHVDVNGAYLNLLQYPRDEVIGEPIYRFVADGPLLSPEEWESALARGDFTGKVDMVTRDGTPVSVQWGAHVEVVTGRAARALRRAEHVAVGRPLPAGDPVGAGAGRPVGS